MIDLIGTLRRIWRRVDMIFDAVLATLVLQETGGTITTTGAVQDVYRNDTPMGTFEPLVVQIDFTNNTAAEIIVVSVYYRIKSGGDLRLKDQYTFAGVQTPALKNIEVEPNRHGVQVTLQRIAGGALTYDWCVFYRS